MLFWMERSLKVATLRVLQTYTESTACYNAKWPRASFGDFWTNYCTNFWWGRLRRSLLVSILPSPFLV